VKAQLSETEYKRLLRIRLSRKIDGNPNMIFCPNLKCEKEVERIGNSLRLECTYCNQLACFKCQQPWHEGRLCNKQQVEAFRCFTFTNDVRRCPKCRVRIEKNEGCHSMVCSRCNYNFCWCCMEYLGNGHIKWYKVCP